MKQKLLITLATYLAYCIDKELYKAIDYLKTQIEVLLEERQKQNKRILLTNKQRIRIAAKAKKLSRKMINDCTLLFTPDTIMGWFDKLIAQKYDGTRNRRKVGRSPITPEIVISLSNSRRRIRDGATRKLATRSITLDMQSAKAR